MNQLQEAPDDHVQVPQVVASYAAYLRARTQTEPQVTVTGEHAELTVSTAGSTLTLVFECPRREWSLRTAEVRRGDQATAYARGKLAEAITAFLAP